MPSIDEIKYFKFTEFNAWEKERWHSFFPLEGNFTSLIWLTRISCMANKKFEEIEKNTPFTNVGGLPFIKPIKMFAASKYFIDFKLYSFEEALSVCANSTSTYLNSEIYQFGKLNEASLQKKVLWRYEKLEQDPLYKGGIKNFINKRSLGLKVTHA